MRLERRPAPPERKRAHVCLRHSVQQVEQHFDAATGQALTDSPNAAWHTLSLPAGSTQDYNRFGAFTIDVLRSPDELSAFTTQNGRRLTPDAQGVYWPLTADASGYWDPAKVYGNVVLTWSTQSRTTDSQFTLLNAILSTLGKPASAVTAKLPASELPCESQGITAAGSGEGTCLEDGVTRTVVNRNHTLHTPGMDVRVTKTKLGTFIKPAPSSYEPRAVRQGRVRGRPVGHRQHRLRSARRRRQCRARDRRQVLLPGRRRDVRPRLPEHVPDAAGRQREHRARVRHPEGRRVDALSEGEVVFPDSPDDEIDFSTKLYAIKLAEPTSEGGQEHGSDAHTNTVGHARAGACGRRRLDLSRLTCRGPDGSARRDVTSRRAPGVNGPGDSPIRAGGPGYPR